MTTPPSDPTPPAEGGSGDLPELTLTPGSADRDAVRLEPGRLVARRYRIVHLVGRGGMGEVYEARDEELGEAVALKTLRETQGHRRALDRLKREIQLARRIAHPAVARTYDLGFDDAGVAFLTMELLAGESLAQRLERGGRMPPAEARPILEQVAAGLGAAHAEGIVHRDLKPANVMLVPGRGAVLTDFGLALEPENDASRLTVGDRVMGTPAYMAPEQVEGRDPTAACDVYAFGAVAYEMVTGRLPFVGETPMAVAAQRLTKDPERPRRLVPDLPRYWEHAILRCLARDAAARPRLSDAVALLRGAQRWRAELPRGWLLAVALLVAGTAVFLGLRRDPPPVAPPSAPAPQPARRSVAVLGFRSLSADRSTSWLSTALAEMFTTELASGSGLRTLPGETVARMKAELGLARVDEVPAPALTRVRLNLGSDYVLAGTYLVLGPSENGRVRLDVRVQDAASGETVAAVADTAPLAELPELVARVATRLRRDLRAGAAAPDALRAFAGMAPPVAQLWAEGLDHLRLFDALAARDALVEAARLDPKAPLVRAALADAWSRLGYQEKAREEAAQAFALAGALPREQRLAVEAQHREAERDWTRAVAVWRALEGLFPDNLEYGLRLSAAQVAAGTPADGRVTAGALRRLGEDPRIDLAEAAAAQASGDHAVARAAARQAAERARPRGALLVVAAARLIEGQTSHLLGDRAAVEPALTESRRLRAEAGDHGQAAAALYALGVMHHDRGEDARAEAAYTEAIRVLRAVGHAGRMARAMNSLANLRASQGQKSEARTLYEESLAIVRATGDRPAQAAALNNLAELANEAGDIAAARRLYEEAHTIYVATGHRSGQALLHLNLGTLEIKAGALGAARTHLGAAFATYEVIGEKRLLAYTLGFLGTLDGMTGELARGRKRAAEAVALMRGVTQDIDVAILLRRAAELALLAGDGAAARTLVDEAAGLSAGDAAELAQAQIVAARVALAEGRSAEAARGTHGALAGLGTSGPAGARSDGQRLLAEIALAEGKRDAARRAAREASLLAEKDAVRERQLQGRLVAAQAAGAVGDADGLRAVAQEAESAGFVAVAQRARLAEAEARGDAPAAERVRAEARRLGYALPGVVTRQAP